MIVVLKESDNPLYEISMIYSKDLNPEIISENDNYFDLGYDYHNDDGTVEDASCLYTKDKYHYIEIDDLDMLSIFNYLKESEKENQIQYNDEIEEFKNTALETLENLLIFFEHLKPALSVLQDKSDNIELKKNKKLMNCIRKDILPYLDKSMSLTESTINTLKK